MLFGFQFGIIFKKNGSENGAEKSKQLIIDMSRGFQRGRLACALSNKKQQFELEMMFEFVFIAFFMKKVIGNAVCIGFHCKCSETLVGEM